MDDYDGQAVYWELHREATRGGLRPAEPGRLALRGAAAAEAGARDLMWATGADNLDQALAVARGGRPRLSPGEGRSPVVRARLEEAGFAALEALAERTGQSQSELVRQGVKLVLAAA
ncbi:MAG: ribbon-helix-helix domain-containing protein [Propionibacteriaceae bacterium]|jgi:hypothetical protein|nr:ribbon-helix-helix domain-containing protein [Propionibacteriaceae bacterium]